MSGVSTATMLAVGGLAVSGFGTITSAIAQQQQGAAAENIANANAMALQGRAQQIQQETKVRADIQARENARKLGATRAAYGASGVTMEGTPLDVMADQATEGELQTQLIKYGGATQSAYLMQQAALARMGGAAARDAASSAAGSTLLTGGSRIAMGAGQLFPSGTKSTGFDPKTGARY